MVINSNFQPFPCVFPLRRFHPFLFPCTFIFHVRLASLAYEISSCLPKKLFRGLIAQIHKAQVCTIYCSHQTNKTEKRKVLGPRWTYSIYDTTLARFQKPAGFFSRNVSLVHLRGFNPKVYEEMTCNVQVDSCMAMLHNKQCFNNKNMEHVCLS